MIDRKPVIGVVGNGVVGNATARVWMEHAEVRVYDVVKERRTHTLPEVLAADLVHVCLPTPKGNPGPGLDVSVLMDFFANVAVSSFINVTGRYVIRSTVPVGFTESMAQKYPGFDIIHSPEFLTARCAVTDAHTPSRNIIGNPYRGRSSEAAALYIHLLLRRFLGVMVLPMHSSASELVKLATNSLFAVKVAAFNELQGYAAENGINWQSVLEGILSDGRIAHAHTQVPGPDGCYGFGGECLPKDLNEMVRGLGERGMVFNAALRRNEVDRKRNR